MILAVAFLLAMEETEEDTGLADLPPEVVVKILGLYLVPFELLLLFTLVAVNRLCFFKKLVEHSGDVPPST